MDGREFQKLDALFQTFTLDSCLEAIAQQMVAKFPVSDLPPGFQSNPLGSMQTVPPNVLRTLAKQIWEAGLGTLPTYVSGGTTYTSVSGLAMQGFPWTS